MKFLNKKYLIIPSLFLALAFFVSPANACDFTKIPFGSSISKVKNKYGYEEDILSNKYFEMNLRAPAFCKSFKNGFLTLTFYDDKLTKFSLRKNSEAAVLYTLLNKQFGELAAKPNFKEIKQQKFASFMEHEKLNINYTYHNLENEVFESVNISNKEESAKLNEYIAKEEEVDTKIERR